MSYPEALDATHIIAYQDGIKQLAQQKTIPILGAVTKVQGSGTAKSVSDYLGESDYAEKEHRSRTNEEITIEAKRRFVVHRKDVFSSGYIDKVDKLRASLDPTGPLMQSRYMAVRRGIHDRILGIKKVAAKRFIIDPTEGRGIMGSALEGAEYPTNTVAFPSEQVIAHGSTGLTLEKLIEAQERLHLADHGLEDDASADLFAMISPKQVTNLLNIAAAAGDALNLFMQEQLKTGKPTQLVGMTWMVTNRLPYTTASSAIRQVPIWSKANVVAAFWEEIQGNMWQDTHADNKPFQKVHANLDATRHEDDGVIILECDEAA